jgi:hypothetical protein
LLDLLGKSIEKDEEQEERWLTFFIIAIIIPKELIIQTRRYESRIIWKWMITKVHQWLLC